MRKKSLLMAVLAVADIIVINLAVLIAFFIRNEFSLEAVASEVQRGSFWLGAFMLSIIYILLHVLFRLYRVMWKYATLTDVCTLVAATMLSYVVYGLARTAFNFPMMASIYVIAAVCGAAGTVFVRLVARVVRRRPWRAAVPKKRRNNTMIIGGGDAANLLMHEIKFSTSMEYFPVCIIDDDTSKRHQMLYGVKIVGGTDMIEKYVETYNVKTIIFAIPSCPPERKAEILRTCSNTGCAVKTLPGIDMIIDNKVGLSDIREVNIEDLLGRPPIKIKLDSVMSYVSGKVVMVTGGGGSIGSELCRQIAEHSPKQLIIFDIYENNAYDIQNELKKSHPELDMAVLIGSVRDSKRLDAVFDKYRPQIVYHAAAHKHVPLMEDNPNESVKNNVFGTLKTVRAADKYGVERFVLISTDKAVNPTNIMGATKRICEMIVQTYNKHSNTEFVAVRFGNVLGSNGSVIPLFKKQIAQGGPVTVTHRDIIRYFMTIPEAVSLVLQAGASAKGGEIFVLDMGEPVRISELAENLIRLSGFKPNEDIKIEYIGLRPGEKLYEELLMDEEGLQATENSLIHIGKPLEINEEEFFKGLDELGEAMYDDSADIRAIVRKIVPTYHQPTVPVPEIKFFKTEEQREKEDNKTAAGALAAK